MGEPAQIASEFMKELDQRVPVLPFRAKQILRDCLLAASRTTDSTVAAGLFFVAGYAQLRLHDYAAAAGEFRKAKLAKYPDRVPVLVNLGAALMGAGRYEEAVRELADGLQDVGDNRIERALLLANLAEGLSSLGQIDDANAAFQEALDTADFTDPRHLFFFALEAAELGAEADAAALYARYVAHGKHVPSQDAAFALMTDGDRTVLDEHPRLRRAVAKARHAFAETVAFEPGVDDAGALDVYEATRSSRQRANTLAFGEPDGGGPKTL